MGGCQRYWLATALRTRFGSRPDDVMTESSSVERRAIRGKECFGAPHHTICAGRPLLTGVLDDRVHAPSSVT